MEFELKEQQYRAGKLDVFAQFKVTRKLLPLLAGTIGDLKSGAVTIEGLLPKVADAVASMSDEDCNAIMHPCLSVVSRKNGSTWTPIFRDGVLMFDDIDMMAMLQIVGNVVKGSLGDFFTTPQGSETAIQ